jgi:hypothetical protein
MGLCFVLLPAAALANEDCRFYGTIKNETGRVLALETESLSWGKWESSPPALIREEGSFRASGRQGSASGTEGVIVYKQRRGNTDNFLKITWDVPFGGDATYKVTVSPDMEYTIDQNSSQCRRDTWACWVCGGTLTLKKK